MNEWIVHDDDKVILYFLFRENQKGVSISGFFFGKKTEFVVIFSAAKFVLFLL